MSRTRRGGLTIALLAVVVAFVALPAHGASPSPSPTPEPEDPIRVTVTELLPRAPRPGGLVRVAGVLRNSGSVAVTDLRVRLQVGDVVITRGGLQDADQERPPTSPRVRIDPALRTLPPGASTAFAVTTTVAELGLERIGVYPLDVVARGNAGDGIESLGLAPTWLPYFGSTTPRPTRVAVLWPLQEVPQLGADGRLRDARSLRALLAPKGRLGRLVAAARAAQVAACEPALRAPGGAISPGPRACDPVAVTFAVDGELLDAVQLLVAQGGSGADVARAWLEQVRGAGLADRVLAVPYADPDVSALGRSPRTKDDIGNAVALSTELVRSVLAVDPVTSVAWPPPGPVLPPAADALALGGARAFVLDPSAYEGDEDPPDSVPNAHALFTTSATGTPLTGLVVDPDLSLLLTRSTPYGPRVTEQRFLAETAIVAAQQPSVSRTLVLALPRQSGVGSAAVDQLRDLGRVPWLCDVPLVAVASSTESCSNESGRPPEPEDRGAPSTDTSELLPQTYLAGVAADRAAATQLTDAVLSAAPAVSAEVAALKARLRRAVARAESSSARQDAELVRVLAGGLHDEVRRLQERLVLRGGRSLLTSTKGRISVSLENTLELPVQVRVRFTSKTATLTNAETDLLTVQPGHAVEASVEARAQRSGQFVVFAGIVDREGRPFGQETEVIVRSTRFGRLALSVTLAAAGVLLLAAGSRIALRLRGRRG